MFLALVKVVVPGGPVAYVAHVRANLDTFPARIEADE